MDLPITPHILDEYKYITGNDIRKFLSDYAIFNQSDYSNISNFYTGKSKDVDAQAFINFKELKASLKEVFIKFQQFNKQLENIKFVGLLDLIEECNDTLRTLNNINRWARSTRDLFGYNPNLKIKYVFSQYDSLEKIADFVVQSDDPQNDWWKIAVDNNLSEENYSPDGGGVLNVTKSNREVENFQVYSVMDVIDGKSIYGRDIDQEIHFRDGDLAYLNEDDTISQAVEILATLRRRDNLDFLDHGLQASLVIGQSKSLFNFPVVERQMQDIFKNDDTLKDFRLTGYEIKEDNVFINFTVTTRLDEVRQLETQI